MQPLVVGDQVEMMLLWMSQLVYAGFEITGQVDMSLLTGMKVIFEKSLMLTMLAESIVISSVQ